MAQATVQREILDTLSGLKEEVNHLKKDMHQVIEYLEDSRLTGEEKVLVQQSIAKMKAGSSNFISHRQLKQKLKL